MSRQRDAVCKRPVYLDALISREKQTMSELVTSTAAALFPLQRISSERPGGTCPLRRPSNIRASGTCGGGKKGRPTDTQQRAADFEIQSHIPSGRRHRLHSFVGFHLVFELLPIKLLGGSSRNIAVMCPLCRPKIWRRRMPPWPFSFPEICAYRHRK